VTDRPRTPLQGRTAIVTGAGRGIGRSIALALAAAGAAVVAVSRTAAEVEKTAALLSGWGQPSLAIAADVADWPAVQDLVERAVRQFGGVHILVNNAGVQGPIGPLVDNDPEAWWRTVQVNLLGTFHCCKAVLPHMIVRQQGKIVNLSGGGATSSRPHFSAYAASKAAVVRLTETLAEEVRPYHIQVNAVAPGAVNTRMWSETLAAGAAAGLADRRQAQRQLETGGTPPELAAALVAWLASDATDGLTGKLIAAPYDGWQDWDDDRIAEVMSAPWFTLRRLDPHTLRELE
jgi:NAD(P)-dependent dehydrogenase (short-subunit alcohol dehydrogenase family)